MNVFDVGYPNHGPGVGDLFGDVVPSFVLPGVLMLFDLMEFLCCNTYLKVVLRQKGVSCLLVGTQKGF